MPTPTGTDARTDRLAALTGGMRLPLIAAPMFLVSGPDLVLAACRAGIGGAFPAPNARDLDILDNWLQRIAGEHAALQRTAAGPVGPWAINLVTHRSYDRLAGELERVARYRPPLVITALGGPQPVIDTVHGWGGLVFADVSSVAFARKAAAAGADGLVLVCAGAGGHTGNLSPFTFIAAVREFYDGIIVLAGGIGSGRAIRAAQLLGADLAYAGTPFIAAHESMAPARYRDMLVRAGIEDLVLTPAFTGAPAWYLRESIEAAGLDPDDLKGKTRVDWSNSQGQLKAWRDIWSAGQGVGTLHAIEPLAAIVARLCDEYRDADPAAAAPPTTCTSPRGNTA